MQRVTAARQCLDDPDDNVRAVAQAISDVKFALAAAEFVEGQGSDTEHAESIIEQDHGQVPTNHALQLSSWPEESATVESLDLGASSYQKVLHLHFHSVETGCEHAISQRNKPLDCADLPLSDSQAHG